VFATLDIAELAESAAAVRVCPNAWRIDDARELKPAPRPLELEDEATPEPPTAGGADDGSVAAVVVSSALARDCGESITKFMMPRV